MNFNQHDHTVIAIGKGGYGISNESKFRIPKTQPHHTQTSFDWHYYCTRWFAIPHCPTPRSIIRLSWRLSPHHQALPTIEIEATLKMKQEENEKMWEEEREMVVWLIRDKKREISYRYIPLVQCSFYRNSELLWSTCSDLKNHQSSTCAHQLGSSPDHRFEQLY